MNPDTLRLLVLIGGVVIFYVAVGWRIFEKAGRAGWKSIVPVYNLVVLLRIVERPLWWLPVILLVPGVNAIMLAIVNVDLAKRFGKSAGFGIGLFLLGFIFAPILAFGNAAYQGAPEEQTAPAVG